MNTINIKNHIIPINIIGYIKKHYSTEKDYNDYKEEQKNFNKIQGFLYPQEPIHYISIQFKFGIPELKIIYNYEDKELFDKDLSLLLNSNYANQFTDNSDFISLKNNSIIVSIKNLKFVKKNIIKEPSQYMPTLSKIILKYIDDLEENISYDYDEIDLLKADYNKILNKLGVINNE